MDAEKQYSQLDSRVAALESDMSNLIRSVDRLNQSIDGMSQRVSASGATNWGVLGTWTAVLVTVIGGLGTLALLPVRERMLEVDSRLELHRNELGHPATLVSLQALKEDYEETKDQLTKSSQEKARAITALDEALQREMRDLDSAVLAETTARIETLDTTLQREFNLIADNIRTKEGEESKRIERMLVALDENTKVIHDTKAAHAERLNAIERALFTHAPTPSWKD